MISLGPLAACAQRSSLQEEYNQSEVTVKGWSVPAAFAMKA